MSSLGSTRFSRLVTPRSTPRYTVVRGGRSVIGSGIAGLSYALQVADHGSVAVVTKDEAQEGSTRYAQVTNALCQNRLPSRGRSSYTCT
eukprot:6046205-Pyramimonas_sp.AAC.1